MSSSNFDDDDGPLRPDLIYSSDEDEFDDDDDYDDDDLLGALGDEFIRTELNKKFNDNVLSAEEEKQMFENITPIQKGNFQN